ncbi:MAG TPA: LysM peptidoglycan-binding domain-containing protein [Bacillota bacterium]|jgi:N-acetylmuramoyl-L-alanine amidase|nr:LysM peptidoglycan-binding domain-containing protein [Bacillota bacterium]HOL11221.1 LysM peptidoglycan-binding domain-containing protein [Bacillota bacterium]HPO98941.1 LysM peptidoglycan-binding domain-containing protein [Bacillota bacterium]
MAYNKGKAVFFIISLLLVSIISSSNIVLATDVYYVQAGDSLYGIARRFNTSPVVLQRINGLESDLIYPGQALKILKRPEIIHQVQSGETLYQIAKQYQTTVAVLKEINLLADERIYPGQNLIIVSDSVINKPPIRPNTYTIQEGDNLYQIAKRFQIPLELLCLVNNIDQTAIIKPGQIMRIPVDGAIQNNIYQKIKVNESELELLARLVTAEAKGEPLEGQVAVAATVLNRVLDARYPNSVYDVIYHVYKGRYQFSPISDGRINEPATQSAYEAVQLALSGWDPSNGARGFFNPDKSLDAWVRAQTVTATIGNHVFITF